MRGDSRVNNSKSHRYSQIEGKSKQIKWGKIKMGDILEIKKDEVFPADMLLLYAENNAGNPIDIIYIDTMNLDGESNLKPRSIIDSQIDSEKKLQNLSGSLFYDRPNADLDRWEGQVKFGKDKKPLYGEAANLLLRGCTLKNVKRAYGVVIYVGPQAKIMMNAKKAPVKVSNVMKLMNMFLYTVFALQIFLIIILSTISYTWKDQNREKKYTSSSDAEKITVNFGTWLIQLLTYWVAYSHMIPISLYVMIEIMKLLLARLINADEELRDKETKAYSDVRNSDLIEELGQVQFVFSDKTGTLTQNKMEFKKFSVGGLIYPEGAELSWSGKPESE